MKVRSRTWIQIGVALLIVLALFWLRSLALADWVAAFGKRIQELGIVGLLVYALVYALATILLLPGSVLTLAAGAAFGLLPGFGSVWVGASVGAALSFLVSRHLARRRVEKWMQSKPRFAAVDRAVGREGWKIVLLTRLSPIFPFNFQNYAYGLTQIPFWHYTLSSVVGILPGTFLYVYLGAVGRSGLEAAAGGGEIETLRLILQVVGLVATAVVTVYIARIATKALKKSGVTRPV
jgi:uncharacterized membrane protein YdjX (TVP38/TMEM64 family)